MYAFSKGRTIFFDIFWFKRLYWTQSCNLMQKKNIWKGSNNFIKTCVAERQQWPFGVVRWFNWKSTVSGHWTQDGSSGQMLWHTHACGKTTSTTSHCPLSRRGVKFCVAAILLHCSVQKLPFLDPEWTLESGHKTALRDKCCGIPTRAGRPHLQHPTVR